MTLVRFNPFEDIHHHLDRWVGSFAGDNENVRRNWVPAVDIFERGEETVETVLDYSGDDDELERVRRREARALLKAGG